MNSNIVDYESIKKEIEDNFENNIVNHLIEYVKLPNVSPFYDT